MLSVVEINELLKTLPRGYIAINNEFFQSTNRALLPGYKKLGVISNTELDAVVNSELPNTNLQAQGSSALKDIYCNVPGCQCKFDSVSDYQMHYNSLHRFLCGECQRSLPTAHLLDLHVSEQHDSYFAVRVERGEVMFPCYLEECSEKLLTPEQRKAHCIRVHKFPGNYRFDQLSSKSATSKCKKHIAHKVEKSQITKDESMETEEDEVLRKLKMFSFNNQKERTFNRKKQ